MSTDVPRWLCQCVQELATLARQVLLKDQGHAPILLSFEHRRGPVTVVAVDDGRDLATAADQHARDGAQGVVLIYEAWLLAADMDRREALIVAGGSPQGLTMAAFEIHRNDDGRIVDAVPLDCNGTDLTPDRTSVVGLRW